MNDEESNVIDPRFKASVQKQARQDEELKAKKTLAR